MDQADVCFLGLLMVLMGAFPLFVTACGSDGKKTTQKFMYIWAILWITPPLLRMWFYFVLN